LPTLFTQDPEPIPPALVLNIAAGELLKKLQLLHSAWNNRNAACEERGGTSVYVSVRRCRRLDAKWEVGGGEGLEETRETEGIEEGEGEVGSRKGAGQSKVEGGREENEDKYIDLDYVWISHPDSPSIANTTSKSITTAPTVFDTITIIALEPSLESITPHIALKPRGTVRFH